MAFPCSHRADCQREPSLDAEAATRHPKGFFSYGAIERLERAVELANNVVWEDRTITIRNVNSKEASELSLRKEPSREGELRLIEIEGEAVIE